MPSSGGKTCARSEEHTSELQSHDNLVCRLLLEKKKKTVVAPAALAGAALDRVPPGALRAEPALERVPPAPRPRGRVPGEGDGDHDFFLSDGAPPGLSPLPQPHLLRF